MSDAIEWDDLPQRKIKPRKVVKRTKEEREAAIHAATVNGTIRQMEKQGMIDKPKKQRKKRVNHETKLQAKIIKALNRVPGVTEVERTNAGKPPIPNGDGTFRYFSGGKAGKADIHLTYRGVRYALEVKILKPYKSYARENQEKYLIKFAENGVASVVRSVDDALDVLESGQVGEVYKW